MYRDCILTEGSDPYQGFVRSLNGVSVRASFAWLGSLKWSTSGEVLHGILRVSLQTGVPLPSCALSLVCGTHSRPLHGLTRLSQCRCRSTDATDVTGVTWHSSAAKRRGVPDVSTTAWPETRQVGLRASELAFHSRLCVKDEPRNTIRYALGDTWRRSCCAGVML